jgi:hypothetical protein
MTLVSEAQAGSDLRQMLVGAIQHHALSLMRPNAHLPPLRRHSRRLPEQAGELGHFQADHTGDLVDTKWPIGLFFDVSRRERELLVTKAPAAICSRSGHGFSQSRDEGQGESFTILR